MEPSNEFSEAAKKTLKHAAQSTSHYCVDVPVQPYLSSGT
ncbi:hypothetical protein GCHA_2207 [Paraglaciecola chathamensis S18K6]|uniref:Uncharacterized protein n=1 Tax=Paraglaciecola chathamensis S18K6 TaxID=1127672 RepID=A0AAV3UZQ0_9ALTE|nr:hypothetical protein GCHA_2207 [Paraglaciecola chathamensis S18K6]